MLCPTWNLCRLSCLHWPTSWASLCRKRGSTNRLWKSNGLLALSRGESIGESARRSREVQSVLFGCYVVLSWIGSNCTNPLADEATSEYVFNCWPSLVTITSFVVPIVFNYLFDYLLHPARMLHSTSSTSLWTQIRRTKSCLMPVPFRSLASKSILNTTVEFAVE